MSRAHRSGGESPEEGKTQEGLGRAQVLTTPTLGTDSRGEQSREVGQRHRRRFLGVAAGAPLGPPF